MSVATATSALLDTGTTGGIIPGFRWNAFTTLNGDGSGGTADIYVGIPNWGDMWGILDTFLVSSNNAATDAIQLTIQNTSLPALGALVYVGVLNVAVNAATFYHNSNLNKPVYLGLVTTAGTGTAAIMKFSINPNTNLKAYSLSCSGRLFLKQPTLIELGI